MVFVTLSVMALGAAAGATPAILGGMSKRRAGSRLARRLRQQAQEERDRSSEQRRQAGIQTERSQASNRAGISAAGLDVVSSGSAQAVQMRTADDLNDFVESNYEASERIAKALLEAARRARRKGKADYRAGLIKGGIGGAVGAASAGVGLATGGGLGAAQGIFKTLGGQGIDGLVNGLGNTKLFGPFEGESTTGQAFNYKPISNQQFQQAAGVPQRL